MWGWIVAGAAPGLQIRASGRRTFRGVFDSHASPPKTLVNIKCGMMTSGEYQTRGSGSCLFNIGFILLSN